ncbi:MAG: spermidine synthase, partial [Micavibrio sp.]|nr:spermidine synthase [Micavibrio sp.]
MTSKILVPLYALTLILSAFLLFSVQPMFAKMILPFLGGSPSVWNIAMVFFQGMLLGGYAYAHMTSRHLSVRTQAILHILLLSACAVFLPLALPSGLQPSEHPALWQIGLMAGVVGAPFFILSASAPLVQHWFAATDHKDASNPYFLYAASNIGSMVALLSYPVVVEPLLTVRMQNAAWAGGYGVLIALMAFCALLVWNRKTAAGPVVAVSQTPVKIKLAWLALAFIPSSLMLGVTTYITTDMASIPLLWILPLSLYLLTFILVFARREIVKMHVAVSLFTAFITLLIVLMAVKVFDKSIVMLAMHLLVFFFASLLCHKKLADMRPPASDLTGFYMIMSLGGVLGGAFNALVAPFIFVMPLEYTLVLCAVLFVRGYAFLPEKMRFTRPDLSGLVQTPRFWLLSAAIIATYFAISERTITYVIAAALLAGVAMASFRSRPVAYAVVGSIFLMVYSPIMVLQNSNILELRRNFFGVLQVSDHEGLRNFFHGTTLHGAQPISPQFHMTQMTYYHPLGPVGDMFRILDGRKGPQRIGAIGLGTGTIACYKHKDRIFDFYEIDADVVEIAENKKLFSYLSNCGSPYHVTLGDGRLTLENVPDGTYDALIVDAFSSDNIPMHLLTLEALELYMRKVKAGGMIAFNISNRYLDLKPQLASLSRETRVPVIFRYSPSGKIAPDFSLRYAPSIWAVFSPNLETLLPLRKNSKWEPVPPTEHRVWTDDYANILSS